MSGTTRDTTLWRPGAYLLLAAVSLAFAHFYIFQVESGNGDARVILHNQIITLADDAPAPFRYRLLMPFLAHFCLEAVEILPGSPNGFTPVYSFLTAVSTFAFLALLWGVAALWFAEDRALVAPLWAGMILVTAMREHYYAPWSIPEGAFVCAGILLGHRRSWHALLLVTILATANRETGFLVPCVAGFVAFDRKEGWRSFRGPAASVVAWALTLLAIRRLCGYAPPELSLSQLWERNTSARSLVYVAVNGFLVIGLPAVLAMRGWRHAPPAARRLVLMIPLYALVWLPFALWREVRLMIPILPCVLTLALAGLYPCNGSAATRATEATG